MTDLLERSESPGENLSSDLEEAVRLLVTEAHVSGGDFVK
jgi:hypothetical protein